jgi:hypothetical protein
LGCFEWELGSQNREEIDGFFIGIIEDASRLSQAPGFGGSACMKISLCTVASWYAFIPFYQHDRLKKLL